MILNENGQVELYADRVGDLYYVRQFIEDARAASSHQEQIKISIEELHKRFGYANVRDILNAVRKDVVSGVQLEDSGTKLDCDVCLKGKMSKTPFPGKSDRKTEVLDLIHTDVCGPMRTNSLGGARYYVEFIDDSSRSEVRFLKSKAEVYNATVEYIALVENMKGKKVKSL